MTWTKLDDGEPDRLWDLSDRAFRLYISSKVFANRLLTDGTIARNRLESIPAPQRVKRSPVIAELVTAGLWAKTDDGWTIVDFLGDQLSREEVECKREYDRVRQRIAYEKSPVSKKALAPELDASLARLNAARERRRAQTSHREKHRETHSDSLSPRPSRPVPTLYKVEDGIRAPEFEAPVSPMNCDRCNDPIDDHGTWVKSTAAAGKPFVYVHRERCEKPEAVAS